jgi:hypothetical protein
MASNHPQFGIKTNALPPHRRYGAIQSEEVPKHMLWPKRGWGLLVPLSFAGNVVVAILAWFLVALVMG